MAEGFLRAKAPESFEAFSAGAAATSLNPLAAVVMAEVGIDISSQRSKPVSEFEGWEFDYVVTVCAGDACPVFAGAAGARETWGVADPAAAGGSNPLVVQAFREARDEISARVDDFVRRNS